MPEGDEDIDELMKKLENLKRKRDELSGDTNRILTEQRQLDQSAVEMLDLNDDMGRPSPAQMTMGPQVTCACGKAVSTRFRHCPYCGKELVV